MKEKKWVQHISGQGQKWEVTGGLDKQDIFWECYYEKPSHHFDLPKSEYRECEPPEKWEDVTDRCCISCDGKNLRLTFADMRCTDLPQGYRFRKVCVCDQVMPDVAFIVERKL